MLKINYNAMVKVKLDDNGKAIYASRYGKKPDVDENGFSQFPLWDIMAIFGSNSRAGTSFTEDGCIYMKEADVEKDEPNKAFSIIQEGENIGFVANPNMSDEEFAKSVVSFFLM